MDINTSGTLTITATNSEAGISIKSENNYIIDIIPPSVPAVNVDVQSPYNIDAPQITFSATDNLAIDYYTITYTPDNAGTGVG